MKVVDVTMHVTCREDDVEIVKASLNNWFCETDIPLVQRPKIGGMYEGKPRPVRDWMKPTLFPESM